MYLCKSVRHGVGPMVLLLTLIGCASIGPAVIPRDRTDYLSSIADSWKEQTLLNVVRIRYGDSPSFLDVSSVISNYAVGGQLTAGYVANSNLTGVVPWNTATVGAGVAYQDRPTISYTPLTGDKFTRSLLRPITPVGIFQLIQAGYAADFILQVTVRSLNGIKNQGTSAGQVQPADPAFYPLLAALRRLQLSQMVSLRLEKRGPEEVGILVLASSRTPQVNQDLKLVMDTLGLRPGKERRTQHRFRRRPTQRQEIGGAHPLDGRDSHRFGDRHRGSGGGYCGRAHGAVRSGGQRGKSARPATGANPIGTGRAAGRILCGPLSKCLVLDRRPRFRLEVRLYAADDLLLVGQNRRDAGRPGPDSPGELNAIAGSGS